ncbi:hypothetical protein ACFVMC_22315 [Nocardia sp. NPDC127579]|uniref:helix-turn-helix transcriptional regulator n=1 Tax=Nocardia sp. NPDC127579 TaxID=3345402 RepID=UPI00364281B6
MPAHDAPFGVERVVPDESWGGNLQRILGTVREEAVVAVSAPRRMKRYYQSEALVLRDLLDAGRRVRVLYSRDYAVSRVPDPGPFSTLMAAHTKVTGIDFPNTIIVDRRMAVVWSAARSDAVLVREPSLLRALYQFTTTTWDSATLLARQPRLDAMSAAVVQALGAGLTDEAAAKRLSVSLRTYRRHVALLMARLGVRTRFQLGARIAQIWQEPADLVPVEPIS